MIIKKQNGFILITGLILLLIMTLVVLYNMSGAIIQEKSSGSTQDQNTAFQNAETALRYAENYIYLNNIDINTFDSNCTNGLCLPSTTSTPNWNNINWANDTTHSIQLPANTIPNTTQQPKFIIELLGGAPSPAGESSKISSGGNSATAYRISATGFGNRNSTIVQLQSVFIKR